MCDYVSRTTALNTMRPELKFSTERKLACLQSIPGQISHVPIILLFGLTNMALWMYYTNIESRKGFQMLFKCVHYQPNEPAQVVPNSYTSRKTALYGFIRCSEHHSVSHDNVLVPGLSINHFGTTNGFIDQFDAIRHFWNCMA